MHEGFSPWHCVCGPGGCVQLCPLSPGCVLLSRGSLGIRARARTGGAVSWAVRGLAAALAPPQLEGVVPPNPKCVRTRLDVLGGRECNHPNGEPLLWGTLWDKYVTTVSPPGTAFRAVSGAWPSHITVLCAFADGALVSAGGHEGAIRFSFSRRSSTVSHGGRTSSHAHRGRERARCSTPSPTAPRLSTLTCGSWLLGRPLSDVPTQVFCSFFYRICCLFLIDL